MTGDGVWYLQAGDQPVLRLAHRPYWPNSYIKPDLIPGLGISGDLSFAALTAAGPVPLDRGTRVEARFSPGEAEWRCNLSRSGAGSLRLRVRPLVSTNGCVVLLDGDTAVSAHLDLGAGTQPVRTPAPPRRGAGYVVLEHPSFPYTQLVAGTTTGAPADIRVQGSTDAHLTLQPGTGLLLIWGYSDYDRAGVATAYRRLEGLPFAASGWVREMRQRWFEHWIGRCLHPEERFSQLMERFPETAAEAAEFWHPRRRLRIETPEPDFDTVVNRAAVEHRYQFEYPAFIHGILGWNKYGKINFGYYAADDAGMHREVEDSLHFIAGSQDAGGRQRYLSAAFHSIGWAEEVDFYFVEQVWHHYRWTGDQAFLTALYPAARRALEHALAASDPDHTGVMTGYYEFWQNDAHSRGGKCVVHGALAWGALRAAAGMAALLGETTDAAQYREYAALVRARLETELWHDQVGAFGSAEWNGDVRPHPETQEQFLPAIRGLGSTRQRRRASRYLRDTFLLRPRAGVTLELINDWWPIFWSHHYVANGDALLSVLGAARSGDLDGYWPLVQSIVRGALTSSDGSLRSTQDNAGRGTGLRHTAEVQAPMLQMVVEGLFGITAAAHENRLVIRPNFPAHWSHARLQRPGLTVHYRRETGHPAAITLQVITDAPRRITVELPIRGRVRHATVDGVRVKLNFAPHVGAARLRLDTTANAATASGAAGTADAATADRAAAAAAGAPGAAATHAGPVTEAAVAGWRHSFRVEQDLDLQVTAPARLVVGTSAACRVAGARIRGWEESSGRVVAVTTHSAGAELRATAAGRVTGFLHLSTGQAEWHEPVDLEVVPAWEVVERLAPALVSEQAAVTSPRLDSRSRSLLLEVRNNTERELSGHATALGCRAPVTVAPGATQEVRISLAAGWAALSPGTVPVTVTLGGAARQAAAVTWHPSDPAWRGAERIVPVDLSAAFTASADHLYGPGFRWRLDYTGCGVGVDTRQPPPPRDARGYCLHHSPMGQLAWGCLPEHTYGLEADILAEFDIQWQFPPLPTSYEPLPGLRFHTGRRRILALAATEPHDQLPSTATLRLAAAPLRLAKLYLLTANLTKSVKSYYPAAEITIHYDRGAPQQISLVPPHTLSCLAQPICPRAYHIPYGSFSGALSSYGRVQDEKIPNLALQDLVLDPTRGVTSLELRCVASETILGILAMSLLRAAPAD